jgi:hypothetical protein
VTLISTLDEDDDDDDDDNNNNNNNNNNNAWQWFSNFLLHCSVYSLFIKGCDFHKETEAAYAFTT